MTLSSDVEKVIIGGDLSRLTPEERLSYYKKVCESVGLNPLTTPFQYLNLQGKLTLYATKACTDQLRAVHQISIEVTSRERDQDCYSVTAKATDANGRTDESLGVVEISGQKGNILANSMMKCETKAKRRVTLSICGLGLLDETEVETIPNARTVDVTDAHAELVTPARTIEPTKKLMNDWTIPDGFFKDKKLKEIPLATLTTYRNTCLKTYRDKPDRSPHLKEIIDNVTAYIESQM